MACFHPMSGWRWSDGEFKLAVDEPVRKDMMAVPVVVPCGTCIGCRTQYARGWALRGLLELAEYDTASFVTLTYEDSVVPPTLVPRHLQLWFKRFRKVCRSQIRFLASGEYGERYLRPHFHAILYGVSPSDFETQTCWDFGLTHSAPVGAGAVAYVAGYVAKKISYRQVPYEFVDYSTGELVTYVPEFRRMSRGRGEVAGIGSRAFDKYREKFSLSAVMNGGRVALPRYFVDRFVSTATAQELGRREDDLMQLIRPQSPSERLAAEELALARHALYRQRRGTL